MSCYKYTKLVHFVVHFVQRLFQTASCIEQLGRIHTFTSRIHTYERDKWVHSESTNPIGLDTDRLI